ncbi:hypothetical protein MTR_4g056560 [Medicago truncatula]|uniref:Uncharacterized protein n=1 Tax=Medicago truncatula TaxID=3880 RepID=A0A072UKM2_MEDTR|nr:hypothetical protein MTR_4g056560 [Medicago truncatula]
MYSAESTISVTEGNPPLRGSFELDHAPLSIEICQLAGQYASCLGKGDWGNTKSASEEYGDEGVVITILGYQVIN